MAVPFAVDPVAVRKFVVPLLAKGPKANLAKELQQHFGVSRPTAHNYLRELIAAGIITRTKPGTYALATKSTTIAHQLTGLEEHEVWTREIQPVLEGLSANAIDIWRYGCTEMINNVIDHSESPDVLITITRDAASVRVDVYDKGVGIFRKISKALNLEDDRHAVLELSKGKVTTDPTKHSGEGIFFSSRAFDSFRILSGGVFFDHECDDESDWILGDETQKVDGTSVFMTLGNDTERKLDNVFDEYATNTKEYRFDRTVVPVKLLEYGDERLVSRSQAKRLLNRFDRFKTVVLNFQDVESIGQAFADEVFRVFPGQHPDVELVPMNANEQVGRMISRAISEKQPQGDLFAATPGSGPQGAGQEGQGPQGKGPEGNDG